MPLTTATAKFYCTADDVAAFLSRTFTSEQAANVAALIPRAERLIEQECNRSWGSGPIVNEATFAPYGLDPPTVAPSALAGWVPIGAAIYCKTTPVQSVENVKGTGWLGSDEIILVRDLDYEVRDLETGLIRIIAPMAYYRIRVDYTPVMACPPDITQATVMLVATWLQPSVFPDTFGVSSWKSPDLQVNYASGTNQLSIPPEVQQILDNYRFRVIA